MINFGEILLVFALEAEEREKFRDYSCLFTGIGKINATYNLTSYLNKKGSPDVIINLGTAGSNQYKKGNVVHCTKFVQRDVDLTALGFDQYQIPFSDMPRVLEAKGPNTELPKAICGTGDYFDTSHTTDFYNVVDMEAFPLAYICQKKKIPFLSLKYISDGANDNSHVNWEESLEMGAKALRSALDSVIN